MSKYLTGLAALALMGAATLPLQANAAERHAGITKQSTDLQSTDLSAHRYYYRHRYWGPRYRYGYWRHRYWGPRYGYYRYGYYGSPYYGYDYPYYRPSPAVSFGVGPFGFRVF